MPPRAPPLPQASPSKPNPGVGTACLYFSATRPPTPGALLYLNGEDGGIVNNMCFPSEVGAAVAAGGCGCSSGGG